MLRIHILIGILVQAIQLRTVWRTFHTKLKQYILLIQIGYAGALSRTPEENQILIKSRFERVIFIIWSGRRCAVI